MTTDTHYPNAPITEAIIDIRVDTSDDGDLSVIKRVGESIKDGYPLVEELFEAIGRMAVQPGVGGSTSMQQKALGLKRADEGKKQIVQLRRFGFTFSRLAPYERWSSFQEEARRLWDVYRSETNPDSVTRLAVRYINRIDIPSERVDLKEFFRTSPEISPDLPQDVAQFFMQLRLPQPDISGMAVINQTIVPPVEEGSTSVILDVDLFRDQELPQDEGAIWDYFEDLHRVKNRIFEACITDSTRKLIR